MTASEIALERLRRDAGAYMRIQKEIGTCHIRRRGMIVCQRDKESRTLFWLSRL